MIEVRLAASAGEVVHAVEALDGVFGDHAGWRSQRERRFREWTAAPRLLALAVDAERGQIVGAAGAGAAGGIEAVGVRESVRGGGVGRRLLELVEATLREGGARSVGLGSLDGAVDFYLRCGYVPQLLVQFGPEAESPDALIEALLDGVLAGHDVFRSDWQGHPQLWLQERTVDVGLKRRIEAVAPGIVSQYVMSKAL